MSEALVIEVSKDGKPVPSRPQDYGLTDWHHDKEGNVNYPWYKHDYNSEPIGPIESREDQRWEEECTEEALDNLNYGRNMYAARCEGFKEWERNERLYN